MGTSVPIAKLGALLATSIWLTGCDIVENASANYVETTVFEVVGDEVHMNNEINSKTYDQFVTLHKANPNIKTIVEHSIGGSNDDETMIRLAYYIRSNGLNTKMLSTSEVYSGGVDLFLAGLERTMERGAIIGVHSWSDGNKDGVDYPRTSQEHELNRKYIEDMLGKDEFYWFTIYAAPADDIHVMSESEIEQYGLLTSPIIVRTN